MILAIIAVLLFVFGLYAAPRSSTAAAGLIMAGNSPSSLGVAVCVGSSSLSSWSSTSSSPTSSAAWRSGPQPLDLRRGDPLGPPGAFILRYVVVHAGQAAQIIAS